MCDPNPLEAEDRDLEAHLQLLIPSPPRLQRDTLMFEAGRRAARSQLRRWQGASAVLIAGAVLIGTQLLSRPRLGELQALAPVPRLSVPTPSAPMHVAINPPSPATLGTAREYLRWRSRLVTEGMDALPNPPLCVALPDPPESWARWSPAMGSGSAHRPPLLTPRGNGNRL